MDHPTGEKPQGWGGQRGQVEGRVALTQTTRERKQERWRREGGAKIVLVLKRGRATDTARMEAVQEQTKVTEKKTRKKKTTNPIPEKKKKNMNYMGERDEREGPSFVHTKVRGLQEEGRGELGPFLAGSGGTKNPPRREKQKH